MNRNRLKFLYILIGLFSLVASVIWTYKSFKSNTATVSYLVDALIIILLVVLLLNKNGKARQAVDHSNYLEWITDGNIENCSKLSVGIKSLEDLVRLAIDLDKRVIHDSKLGKYFVLAEDMTYIHDPGLDHPMMDNKQQLGRILIERGLLQPEQLETGLYYQKKIGCKLGESLLALGFIDETILYTTLAAQQKVAYYELDSKKEYKDTSWTSKLSINKAKALQALPLGYRSDGKLVIACGDNSKAGVTVVLKEIFGEEIYIVNARPTKIYEVLDKIDSTIREYSGYAQLLKERKTEAYERLTEHEWEQFITCYHAGKIDTYLFIKASGLVDQLQLAQVPSRDIIISWLTGKGLINGQLANLIKSFERLNSKQSKTDRQSKVMPGTVDLLEEAHYITKDEAAWAVKKAEQVGWPINQILMEDYMVAPDTLEYVKAILDTVKSTISKAKIF
ncbi:MAG: type secretion system protein [Firmicutes bacterium]|nr:type secretion system protein [Bacillota bacterium]